MFGISGVGKTWLLSEVAARTGATHLQASALIKGGLGDIGLSSEELRLAGGDRILANQRLLIAMFDRVTGGGAARLVLFDGHLLIDTDGGLVEIPLSVVAAVRPQFLIHIEAEVGLIGARRAADVLRNRPMREPDVLAAQQSRSIEVCRKYAEALNVPMRQVDSGDVDGVVAICRGLEA